MSTQASTGSPIVASTETAAATSLSPWQQRVQPFATAVNKPVDDISSALAGLTGEPSDDAAAVLSDQTVILDTDLQTALVLSGPKIPLGVFRKHLPKLRGTPPIAASTERATGASFDVLPNVPEDSSFIEMLKVGGELRVGTTEVISAMKAGIADYIGIYGLPARISEKMEQVAEAQEVPVTENFYKIRKLVVSSKYGEILSVLGVDGSFVSDRRKRDFLEKMNTLIWPALSSFHRQLVAWQTSWAQGSSNPAVLMTVLAMGQAGGGAMMPPGMLQPPDTATVRDEAEAVINQVNKVFAGFGIPISRALAYDATRLKGILEDPTLPVALGALNKEQMLKDLGISVGSDYVRLERNITRYAMGIMELKNVPSGNEEYAYLSALLQLGAAIPWDKLPGGSAATVRGRGVQNNGRGRLTEHVAETD